MKLLAPFAALLVAAVPSASTAESNAPSAGPMPSDAALAQLRAVSPALKKYTEDAVFGDLWRRPDLSIRDRSVVTLAVLIARNQTVDMAYYLNVALDNGVEPSEISEIIAHLAFYSGWESAMAAVPIAAEAFAKRGIGADRLPSAAPKLLAINEASDAKRAATVQASIGAASPGLVHYTGDLLFHDLWLRPGLAPRDRSLVTVSALIATGEFAQLPSHLGRALDNGLTRAEVGEVLTQVAFYAGWPNAFSAAAIAQDVLARRSN